MFKNIKWLRITPDRAGRGGTKTGIHSFQQTPVNDVRQLTNAHVYRSYWRRDFDPIRYAPDIVDPLSTACLQIHGYTYPSLTDPSAPPTVTIIQQNQRAGAGTSVIWDTTGSQRQTRPATNQQGTFTNIAGRCFFGDGGTEALVMDDRTPAIHAQPNQPLGIGTPQQPLPLTAGISYSPLGTAYSYNGSAFLNHPNPNNQLATIVASDTVITAFINAGLAGFTLFGSTPSGAVTVAGKTSNTATFTAAGTIKITQGTSLVTLAGATWPVGGEYCGLAINFNGYSFVIAETATAAQEFDINGNAQTLLNDQLLILGVYDGPTVAGIPYTITGAQVKLTVASTALSFNAGTVGYGQSTQSNLVQITVFATRSNGFYRNLGNISLGPAGGGVPDTVTDVTIGAGFTELYSPSGPWVSTDIGKTIVVDHAGDAAGNTMLVTTIGAVTGKVFVSLLSPNANAGIVTNKRAWWVSNAVGVQDAIMAGGSNVITSPSNPWTVNDVGKEIMVAKAGPGGAPADALFGTITVFTSAGQVTLSVNCNGAGVAGVQAYWGGAISNTHVGPTYAYAWYDPETGHMSNISPLFTIPRPTIQGSFADFANVAAMFQIDAGSISYPNATDAIRFSHIMFFRTLSTPGASTLYPIGSLNPYVGKVHPGGPSTRGSWNPGTYSGWMGLPNSWVTPAITAANPQLWFDWSSDSDLLLSGGFRAPQFTNSKPMSLLRGGATQPSNPYCQAYWDRRFWIVPTQEPDKIAFSCDEAQCPLGVPEESFPPTNFLRLPSAADGKVLGMRTVGDMLLITTQRFAYIVAGNNESNYRLMKISSSMPGVGTYQMDEFPTYTGAEGEPTTVFFLGVDRIVYQWTVGGAVTPISQPIQDQLDTALTTTGTYQGSIVHCVSSWGRRLVLVSPYLTSGNAQGGITTFIYDINTQTWSTSYRTDGVNSGTVQDGLLSPMATVYGAAGIPVNEIYGIHTVNPILGIHTMTWIRDDVTVATRPFTLATFPMALDGKKTRKQIVAVNIHATAGTWSGSLILNDQIVGAFTFATYPDPIDSIYAPTGTQGTPDDVVAQDIVALAGKLTPTAAPAICYRVGVTIDKSVDVGPAALYAIDIGYIDYEQEGEGDP